MFYNITKPRVYVNFVGPFEQSSLNTFILYTIPLDSTLARARACEYNPKITRRAATITTKFFSFFLLQSSYRETRVIIVTVAPIPTREFRENHQRQENNDNDDALSLPSLSLSLSISLFFSLEMTGSQPASRQDLRQKGARIIEIRVQTRDDVTGAGVPRARWLRACCERVAARAAVQFALDDEAAAASWSVGRVHRRYLGDALAISVEPVKGVLLLRIVHRLCA